MKQNTKFFKIIALVICLMLILTMLSSYSFASITETTNKRDITVAGIEAGVTVYAYQLTTVDYDYTADQPKSTPYKWNDNVKTWVEQNFSP